MYRSAVFELGLALGAAGVALAVAVVAWRYGRSMRLGRRRTRSHGDAVRLTGRRLPGGTAVVLDADQAAAYCVPGRPATIVVTSRALAVLDGAQLAAVLAHERAHLAGRHHLVIALARGLAASLPGVPVFRQGRAQVATLAEMCADDAAARRSGRPTLLRALLAMGTGAPVPAASLAAASFAISTRVARLLEPASPGRCAASRLALLMAIVLLTAAPSAVAGLAGQLGG